MKKQTFEKKQNDTLIDIFSFIEKAKKDKSKVKKSEAFKYLAKAITALINEFKNTKA